MHMKLLLSSVLAALLLAASSLVAQTSTVDILYLKNGSVIRGQVAELNSTIVKIRTSDGSLFAYSMNEIEKMVKESVTPAGGSALLAGPAVAAPVPETQGAFVPGPAPKKQGVGFGLRGGLFANLEIWDQLQGDPDSKIGFGLNGTLAAGINIDNDMYIGVGPLFGVNFWSQSQKIDKIETSTTWNVMDVGGNLVFGFDDMYIMMGAGSATVSLTATAGSDSKTVEMPESAPYKRVSLGWGDGIGFGISYVSYSDWAQPLSRFEINVGWSF
jgi:hypothetical protein